MPLILNRCLFVAKKETSARAGGGGGGGRRDCGGESVYACYCG